MDYLKLGEANELIQSHLSKEDGPSDVIFTSIMSPLLATNRLSPSHFRGAVTRSRWTFYHFNARQSISACKRRHDTEFGGGMIRSGRAHGSRADSMALSGWISLGELICMEMTDGRLHWLRLWAREPRWRPLIKATHRDPTDNSHFICHSSFTR